MKPRIYSVIGAAIVAAFSACSKVETAEQVETTPPPVEEPAPAPVEQPAEPKVAVAPPAPEPEPEPEKAPEPELAPDGIWFLRQAVSVETDAGIIGVKRGTQLSKTGDASYKTPAGDVVTLTPDQVTNVLAEIREILAAEHMSAAALAQWKQQQQAAQAAQMQVAAQSAPAAAPAAPPANVPPAPPVAPAPQAARAPARKSGALSSSGLGATHGKVDFSNSYNFKQEANRAKGFR